MKMMKLLLLGALGVSVSQAQYKPVQYCPSAPKPANKFELADCDDVMYAEFEEGFNQMNTCNDLPVFRRDCAKYCPCPLGGTCQTDTCNTDTHIDKADQDKPLSCAGEVCTTDECCIPRATCQTDTCNTDTHIDKAVEDKPSLCAGGVCTTDECCSPLCSTAPALCAADEPLRANQACPKSGCTAGICCEVPSREAYPPVELSKELCVSKNGVKTNDCSAGKGSPFPRLVVSDTNTDPPCQIVRRRSRETAPTTVACLLEALDVPIEHGALKRRGEIITPTGALVRFEKIRRFGRLGHHFLFTTFESLDDINAAMAGGGEIFVTFAEPGL